MKRSLLFFLFAAFLISCGNNASSDKNAGTGKQAETENDKGVKLAAANGCYSCHQIDQPSTGPSYMAVAARYPNNEAVIDSLSNKVIKGGSGNWGPVAMIAHPGVSKEDARTMVKYVLSLKK